jgi:hypothetical protein
MLRLIGSLPDLSTFQKVCAERSEPMKRLHRRRNLVVLVILALGCACGWTATTRPGKAEQAFTESFDPDKAELASVGANRYFVLTPGYTLVLEGQEQGKKVVLTITVLDQTKKVDGVETRIVEEKETADGQIAEISRNYFAISKKTCDIYYFGEDVDTYKDGNVAGHEGSWLSGVQGARFGLGLPATPLLGARYQQEVAPKVAMDRAEVVSLSETLDTPAGRFERCLKTEETSGLEDGTAYKLYAPGVGLIQDGPLKLLKYSRLTY